MNIQIHGIVDPNTHKLGQFRCYDGNVLIIAGDGEDELRTYLMDLLDSSVGEVSLEVESFDKQGKVIKHSRTYYNGMRLR